MNLVISDPNGNAIEQTDDFDLKLQYGDACDIELSLPKILEPHYQVHIDGTAYGGVIDKRCPSHTAKGSSINFKGRSLQGIFARKAIMPPSGKTHYTYQGEANNMLKELVGLFGLEDMFTVSDDNSGINLDYRFNRFINGWDGIRMALASQDARLKIVCQDRGHELSVVPCRTYGSLDSERVYFSLDCDDLPVNHLIGLGKGEGTARAISHWYADIFGNVSQTQTLFGVWENALVYQLNSEDASTLPSKTKAKLLEHQEGSPAKVSIPDDVQLDIGDKVKISSAKYRINATTQVIGVAFKHKNGIGKTSYEFGVPDFPDEED